MIEDGGQLIARVPECVDLTQIDGQGRGWIAKRAMAAGTVVMQEDAYEAVVNPGACQLCSRPLPRHDHENGAGASCDQCDLRYCSDACRAADAAVGTAHSLMCGADVDRLTARPPQTDNGDDAGATARRPRFPLLAARMMAASLADSQRSETYWSYVWPLCCVSGVSDAGSMLWVDEHANVRKALKSVWGAEATTTLFDAVFTVTWFQQVLGRFSINCFGLPNTTAKPNAGSDADGGGSGTEEDVGAGLFVAASFVNHDCDPNMNAEFVVQEGHKPALRLLTRRDVAAGEQLTITYLDSSQPTADRQEFLQSNYGFTCGCAMCSA